MDCSPIEFSGHAVRRMFDRRISKEAVITAIRKGKIIAEYPNDAPYPSYLVLGFENDTPLHVVLGVEPITGAARVITVYIPDPDLWENDFRTRRQP
jgi:hypothetical protein